MTKNNLAFNIYFIMFCISISPDASNNVQTQRNPYIYSRYQCVSFDKLPL